MLQIVRGPSISSAATMGARWGDEWEQQRLDQEAFVDGEWPIVFGPASNRCLTGPISYLVFKAVEALIVTGITGWSLYDRFVTMDCGDKYLIYLTHWSLLLQVYYVWISLWAACRISSPRGGYEPMPMTVGAAWVLADISLLLSLFVCVFYWLLIFPHQLAMPTTLTYLTHGANFLIMLLDTVISRTPHHLLHAVYFAGVCASYVLFSLFYWVFDGRDCSNNRFVMKALDWNEWDSWSTIRGLLLFLTFPMACIVFFYLYAMLVLSPQRQAAAKDSWMPVRRHANGQRSLSCGCCRR